MPDWCEIEIDRRVIPGEDAGGCIARVEAGLRRGRLGASTGVEFLPPWVKMPALSPEGRARTPGSRWSAEAVARVTGGVPEVTGVPYGTDAGPLGEAGLPCLVFGPGDIAQAHTKDEWVELDQVRLGRRGLLRDRPATWGDAAATLRSPDGRATLPTARASRGRSGDRRRRRLDAQKTSRTKW